MIITESKLLKLNVCLAGLNWFNDNYKEGVCLDVLIKDLIEENKEDWANWLLSRVLKKDDDVKYAVYAARLVLHIFEDKYKYDKIPRKAIEAAEKCIADSSKVDRASAAANAANAANAAAAAAAAAATSAACTAAAAADAHYAAVADAHYAAVAVDHAVLAVNYAARDAALAAVLAVDHAVLAVNYAARADANGKKAAYKKILAYGMSLVNKQE